MKECDRDVWNQFLQARKEISQSQYESPFPNTYRSEQATLRGSSGPPVGGASPMFGADFSRRGSLSASTTQVPIQERFENNQCRPQAASPSSSEEQLFAQFVNADSYAPPSSVDKEMEPTFSPQKVTPIRSRIPSFRANSFQNLATTIPSQSYTPYEISQHYAESAPLYQRNQGGHSSVSRYSSAGPLRPKTPSLLQNTLTNPSYTTYEDSPYYHEAIQRWGAPNLARSSAVNPMLPYSFASPPNNQRKSGYQSGYSALHSLSTVYHPKARSRSATVLTWK